MLPKEIEDALYDYTRAVEDTMSWCAGKEHLAERDKERAALEAAIVAYAEEARREPSEIERAALRWAEADEDAPDFYLREAELATAVAARWPERMFGRPSSVEGNVKLPANSVEGDGARGESVRDYVVRICDGCRRLDGKMCSTPGCAFCFRSVSEVAAVLDALLLRPVVDGERLDLMTPVAEPAPSEPESGGTTPEPETKAAQTPPVTSFEECSSRDCCNWPMFHFRTKACPAPVTPEDDR